MDRSFWQLYSLLSAIVPLLLLLLGGLGVIYCAAADRQSPFFMGFSLVLLLIGITSYTYQQATKSKVFAERLGLKDKDKKKKSRRMGKRCPQCSRVIYHKRTVCQHCGYEFSSAKMQQGSGNKEISE